MTSWGKAGSTASGQLWGVYLAGSAPWDGDPECVGRLLARDLGNGPCEEGWQQTRQRGCSNHAGPLHKDPDLAMAATLGLRIQSSPELRSLIIKS